MDTLGLGASARNVACISSSISSTRDVSTTRLFRSSTCKYNKRNSSVRGERKEGGEESTHPDQKGSEESREMGEKRGVSWREK